MSSQVTPKLSTAEKARLSKCEATIERGITSFVEVGKALTEIRDSKLYRAEHKSFDAYCQERWDFGRARAYQLIDHAKVAAAIVDAGAELSTAVDIPEWQTRALKGDEVALAKVKDRVASGEAPKAAVQAVVADKKAERDAEQGENDAARERVRAALPENIRRAEEAKARNGSPHAAVTGKRPDAAPAASVADIEERDEEIAALKADLSERDKRLALYDGMAVEFERGGFEAVKATLDDRISSLQIQLANKTTECAKAVKSRDWWKKQAMALGYVPQDRSVSEEAAPF